MLPRLLGMSILVSLAFDGYFSHSFFRSPNKASDFMMISVAFLSMESVFFKISFENSALFIYFFTLVCTGAAAFCSSKKWKW
jgi:hypothetical protein